MVRIHIQICSRRDRWKIGMGLFISRLNAMIVLTRKEFIELPAGTLFAPYDPEYLGHLCVKHKGGYGSQFADKFKVMNIKGEVVDGVVGLGEPADFDDMEDADVCCQQFVVFEPNEILVLIESLKTAYDVNVSCIPLIRRLKAYENSK